MMVGVFVIEVEVGERLIAVMYVADARATVIVISTTS